MPNFQYQQRAEVQSTSPEAVTVDRTQPTYIQPARPLVSACMTAMAFVTQVPTVPETVTVDRTQPTYVQPNRAVSRAAGTTWVGPISTLAEAVTFDRWNPTYPQASRVPSYAPGTTYASPVSESPENTSEDRWEPFFGQPDRTARYAQGTSTVNPVGIPESVTVDRWSPVWQQVTRQVVYRTPSDTAEPFVTTSAAAAPSLDFLQQHPQPNRTVKPLNGSLSVPILTTAQESISVDRWVATWQQPDRSPKPTAQSLHVWPIATPVASVTAIDWFVPTIQPARPARLLNFSVANPVLTTAVETVTADRWQPTWIQPDRSVRRAPSWSAFVSLDPTSIDRWVPGYVQPDRTVLRASSLSVWVPDEPIVVDKFGPTWIQPNRFVRRADGTTVGIPVLVPVPSIAYLVQHPQPDRTVRPLNGSLSVAILSTAPEATSLDRWLPSWRQPDRIVRYADSSGGTNVLGVVTPPATLYRDNDAYINGPATIVALLNATGEFGVVVFSRETNNGTRVSSSIGSAAIVTPGKNSRMIPQPNPARKLRVATYTIEIQVSREEPEDARTEADRLFSVIQNVLSSVSLGGFTLFEQSVVSDDYYTSYQHPVVKIYATCQFGYVVDMSIGGFRQTV